jgi:hypothetical protein
VRAAGEEGGGDRADEGEDQEGPPQQRERRDRVVRNVVNDEVIMVMMVLMFMTTVIGRSNDHRLWSLSVRRPTGGGVIHIKVTWCRIQAADEGEDQEGPPQQRERRDRVVRNVSTKQCEPSGLMIMTFA